MESGSLVPDDLEEFTFGGLIPVDCEVLDGTSHRMGESVKKAARSPRSLEIHPHRHSHHVLNVNM